MNASESGDAAAGHVALSRFVQAQTDVYAQALHELRAGEKRSHWMWFIFPQIAGLGFSAMSQRYAIRDLSEARAYLQHAVLGARLLECTAAVLQWQDRSARQIFGAPDDMKFRSCMTLFELVAAPGSTFTQALDRYFAGKRDARTLELVRQADAH